MLRITRPLGAMVAIVTAMNVAVAQANPANFCPRGLSSPFGFGPTLSKTDVRPYECPDIAQPVVTLDVASRYDQSVETKDEEDAAAAAAYEAAMATIRDYQRAVIRAANTAMRDSKRAQAAVDCAARHLITWAEADALSDMQSHTANQNRGQFLASFALAWLQIRDKVYDGNDRALVEHWISRMADSTMIYMETRKEKRSGQNNHRYWAGLATAASGIVTNRCELYRWGVGALDLAISQVDDNGYLPFELERGQRALEYHMFALGPLLMLAVLEQQQGRDRLADNDGALRRVVDNVAKAVLDPTEIAEMAESEQRKPDGDAGMPASHRLSWAELMLRLDPAYSLGFSIDITRPIGLSGLGGNLTMLLRHEEDEQ